MAGDTIATYGTTRVLLIGDDRPPVASEDDSRDLIGDALFHDARWIAVGAHRLGDAFYTLSTGLAGSILQRLQNYGCGLAVVGDVERRVEASASFRDLVTEAQRGRGNLLFVQDAEELRRRFED